MHLPDIRTGLASFGVFAILAAVLISFASSDTTYAATYAPDSDVRLCNGLSDFFPESQPIKPVDNDLKGNPSCADRSAATSSNPDLTVTLDVPFGDSNFGSPVITIANPKFVTAADADIIDGHKAGGLTSVINLGVLSGACTTGLIIDFVLYDSSTTGSLPVQAEGTPDRWSNIVTDANSDLIADSTSAFVGAMPSIYPQVFDPDLDYFGGPNGSIPPIVPLARYTGATFVEGDWQLLSFFQFSARQLEPFAVNTNNQPHIFGFTGTTDWDLSLSLLNDVGASVTSPSAIGDFCAPLLVETMLLGLTPEGETRLTAPSSSGQYEFWQYSYGQRDADNDGRENSYDTCPFQAGFTDADFDGLHDVCDPDSGAGPPGGGSTSPPMDAVFCGDNYGVDEDGDCFSNTQDGCPNIADGGQDLVGGDGIADDFSLQVNSELLTTYLIAAPDGGPRGDSITDACDPNDTTSTGEGSFVRSTNVMPVCIGLADTNNNGICDVFAIGTAGATYSPDSDYDGYSDALEAGMGTDPNDKCSDGLGETDTWPVDFDNDKVITIVDVLQLKPVFGTISPRHDINGTGGNIDIVDVLQLKPVFGNKCADHKTGTVPN